MVLDFRKAHGVSDDTLQCFTSVEVYLRRAEEILRKKKNFECNRDFDLETLIGKDRWTTIEKMEEVIPYHVKSFQTVIRKCMSNDQVTKNELEFCIRFITTVYKAKEYNGFIDQTHFKTAPKYIRYAVY